MPRSSYRQLGTKQLNSQTLMLHDASSPSQDQRATLHNRCVRSTRAPRPFTPARSYSA